MPTNPIEIKTPQLAGGISRQPMHERFPGQVSDAQNVIFTLADGACKRPGSVYVKKLDNNNPSGGTDFAAGGIYQMHQISRDASEKYIVVYANGILRTFSTAGVEARVAGLSASAATYYTSNVPTVNQLRLLSVADYTIIANTTVALGVTTTPTFTVTAEWENYERMTSHTPTSQVSQEYGAITAISTAAVSVFTSVAHGLASGDVLTVSGTNCFPPAVGIYYITVLTADTFTCYTDSARTAGFHAVTVGTAGYFSTSVGVPLGTGDNTYHKTNKDSAQEPSGYYLYSVNTNFFPTIQFPIAATTPADWSSSTNRGFKIRFEKRQDTFSGVTYTRSTLKLTSSTTWNAYAHQPGDQIYLGSGTDIVPGWYTVVNKIIDSTGVTTGLRLATDPTGGAGANTRADVAGSGIGQQYEVLFPGTGGVMPTMHDVAYFIQQRLQSAGCQDGLVEWTDVGSGSGYFTITGPWRGTGAKVTSITANPSAPTTGTNLTTTGASGAGDIPFNPTGAVRVDGYGTGPRTLPTDQRWTRVAAPGDRDGSIDSTKAPIKMVRLNTAQSGTIAAAGIAVGNPPVITMASHGLVNGQRITFASTTSTPAFTGPYIVASVTTNTFTIAVDSDAGGPALPNVTVTGAGTYSAPAYFTYDVIDWSDRTSGSDASNPSPDPFVNGTKISDIGFHRQRLVIASGEHVMFSAQNDLFRFYLDDAYNLVDSDPIDATLSSDRVTIIDYITPIRETVLITTLAGQHFALTSPDVLSPSSVTMTRAMYLNTHRLRPTQMDPTVYLMATANGKSQLREAYFINDAVPNDAADVSAHVAGTGGDAGLLPSNPQTIASHPNSRRVFILKPSTNKIQVYQSFWVGPKKEQSAWSEWSFGTSDDTRISDICVIDDDLYVLMENTLGGSSRGYTLEKVPMFESAAGTYNYSPHMDRQIAFAAGTGVHVAGVTTWTLPDSLYDTTLNTIVRETGATITMASNTGTTVTASGNYSSVAVTIGRSFSMSIQLSEPFLRDQNGQPNLDSALLQRQMIVRHTNSGIYNVVADMSSGSDVTFTFTPPTGTYVQSAGQHSAWAGANLSADVMYITSTGVTPVNIAGFTHLGQWGIRFNKGG